MPFSSIIVKIFAAEPGAANNIPPLRSIKPMFRSAETHLTVFLIAIEGVSLTSLQAYFTSNVLLIRMGIFLDNNGSNVLG